MSIQCRVVIAEPPRARSVRGEASIVLENGNLPMRENFVMMSGVLTHARPSIRFGRKVLSRLCRGGNGESCSLRLSWRNVNQFTERQPMEFFQ